MTDTVVPPLPNLETIIREQVYGGYAPGYQGHAMEVFRQRLIIFLSKVDGKLTAEAMRDRLADISPLY